MADADAPTTAINTLDPSPDLSRACHCRRRFRRMAVVNFAIIAGISKDYATPRQ
jgi:hypothetical protein